MKKTLFLCLLLASAALALAQNSGRGFSYQAVARHTDGKIKAKENIEIQFTLLPGDQAATPAWQETQVATTDEFGVFTLTIGKGIRSGGSAAKYTDVNFAAAEFWLNVEIKDNGAWQEISKTQLLSVPYAEAAGNAQPAPTGSILLFAGPKEKVPAGWRLCDGTQLSRSEHAVLYNVIGTAWGHGDGSSTFNIPDLRSYIPRGVSYDSPNNTDDGRTNRFALYPGGNTNNNVGSYQGDEIRSHNHAGSTTGGVILPAPIKTWPNTTFARWAEQGKYAHEFGTGAPTNRTLTINNTGGSETRPDNVFVNYIIKL